MSGVNDSSMGRHGGLYTWWRGLGGWFEDFDVWFFHASGVGFRGLLGSGGRCSSSERFESITRPSDCRFVRWVGRVSFVPPTKSYCVVIFGDDIRLPSGVQRVSSEPAKSVPSVVDEFDCDVFFRFRGVCNVVGCWVSVDATPLCNAFDVGREVVSGSGVDDGESVIVEKILCYASHFGEWESLALCQVLACKLDDARRELKVSCGFEVSSESLMVQMRPS